MDATIKTEKGFSLIEVMIAMMILVMGVLAMLAMQSRAITNNFRSSSMSKASNVAAGQIERFRMMDYSADDLKAGNHPPVTTPAPDPATNYAITWSVTDNSPVNGAKRISVSVVVPKEGPTVTYEYIKHRDL